MLKLPKHVPVKYKILNGRKVPVCDFEGKCKNKASKEVYPGLLFKNAGWANLCEKHFQEEQKRLKNKLVYWPIKLKKHLRS